MLALKACQYNAQQGAGSGAHRSPPPQQPQLRAPWPARSGAPGRLRRVRPPLAGPARACAGLRSRGLSAPGDDREAAACRVLACERARTGGRAGVSWWFGAWREPRTRHAPSLPAELSFALTRGQILLSRSTCERGSAVSDHSLSLYTFTKVVPLALGRLLGRPQACFATVDASPSGSQKLQYQGARVFVRRLHRKPALPHRGVLQPSQSPVTRRTRMLAGRLSCMASCGATWHPDAAPAGRVARNFPKRRARAHASAGMRWPAHATASTPSRLPNTN